MKQIPTGKGSIPLLSLIAIWSISLVVNLPGLAISPLLSNLDKIFPKTPDLEIQLLTVLPNFFIIPFILLSGKLSVSRNKVLLVIVGLCIYLVSGIGYFFAKSMTALILLSCSLGIGCGIVIPLATGLLAEYFVGNYRMKQLGIKSGIANISLVISTLIVGWISAKNWHLPFIVYLMPLIPLLLSPYLGKKHLLLTPSDNNPTESKPADTTATNVSTEETKPIDSEIKKQKKIINKKLWGLIVLYFMITMSAVTLSYYLPFLMQSYKMSSDKTGIVTSLFFLLITIGGFTLPYAIRSMQKRTTPACLTLMMVGLFMIAFSNYFFVFCLGAIFIGYGYGILQPIIYDKTSVLMNNDEKKQTLFLSYVFMANYVAVAVAPFIIDFFMKTLKITTYVFPFVFTGFMMLIMAFVARLFNSNSTYAIDPSFYKK